MFTKRLLDTDIVGKLQPYVNSKQIGYNILEDWVHFHTQSETNTPWLFCKKVKGHHCHLFHSVYFGVFGVVPKHCFSHCWKMAACNKGIENEVVKQLTMKEVLEIEEAQEYLGMPSKCGMDKRSYTPNTWGAYWYFHSLAEARRNYNKVKGVLNLINPDINLVIKRSCTEFELALGPSDKWDSLERDWEETEAVLDEWVYRMDHSQEQHPLVKKAVRNRMLYWAHQHGDFTYKHFNRGEDLIYSFPVEKVETITPSITY